MSVPDDPASTFCRSRDQTWIINSAYTNHGSSLVPWLTSSWVGVRYVKMGSHMHRPGAQHTCKSSQFMSFISFEFGDFGLGRLFAKTFSNFQHCQISWMPFGGRIPDIRQITISSQIPDAGSDIRAFLSVTRRNRQRRSVQDRYGTELKFTEF